MPKLSYALRSLALAAIATPAAASLTIYEGNLAGFNAAAGSPPVTIDFESLLGQNLSGQTVSGVTFLHSGTTTLDVVTAASTISLLGGPTHTLPATSGANVLSPGGATLPGGPSVDEQDAIDLVFATPVSAFGLDILFESLDGFSLFGYTIFDQYGGVLASNSFITIPGICCSGSYFLGWVSDDPTTHIARIRFNENDSDSVNPDANVGYDTFRFFAPTSAVPEPASWAMMLTGFGIAALALRRKRRSAGLLAT